MSQDIKFSQEYRKDPFDLLKNEHKESVSNLFLLSDLKQIILNETNDRLHICPNLLHLKAGDEDGC